MARFLFVYRGPKEQHEHEMAPEQMQQIMESWMAWIGKGFEEGWMVDAGDALKLEGKVVNDAKVVSDGPFVESKEIVGGYSIVKCDSFDAAAELAKTCPAVSSPGGSIEIRELAGIGAPE
jgi:hypothetical protein